MTAAPHTIFLYRGMLSSGLEDVRAAGVFRATQHGGNVASTDVSTARHWAGQRGDDDDPGVVVSFWAPEDAIAEDEWFKGDYRFVHDFRPIDLQVVQDGITGPVREGRTLKLSVRQLRIMARKCLVRRP